MSPADNDIEHCKALVIDANPTSRSILVSMLRDMGLASVHQASRVEDARRHLENRMFDVVLCDYHFDRSEYNGQDLLDDLRRANLLPYSTVFIMVTGEATYSRVAEAAESALDGYLLKPHNATTLYDRVNQARHRKAVLGAVFQAIEAGDFESAATLCLARFHARATYWLYAARIGAELLLRLHRHEDARKLYEAVTEMNAAPWSRLGVARAQAEAGQLPAARRTLESLLVAEPAFADAYDVMGRVQMEQGDLEQAMETYRRATTLTPSSVGRLQKQGTLCFYMGEKEEAATLLERAMSIGLNSKLFDFQSLVMLALLNFDRRDHRGLHRCQDTLQRALEKVPQSTRLRRFVDITDTFRELVGRQLAQVVATVKEQAREVRLADYDFEAACNFLAMLTRVRTAEIELADAELWIGAIARRFCVSKATTELLVRCCTPCTEYTAIVHAGQQELAAKTESAMAHSLDGRPGDSVEALLKHGADTLNSKMIDMAKLVLQRHRSRIEMADDVMARIDDLQQRYSGGQIQIGSSVGRQAGAITLRAATPPAAAVVAGAVVVEKV